MKLSWSFNDFFVSLVCKEMQNQWELVKFYTSLKISLKHSSDVWTFPAEFLSFKIKLNFNIWRLSLINWIFVNLWWAQHSQKSNEKLAKINVPFRMSNYFVAGLETRRIVGTWMLTALPPVSAPRQIWGHFLRWPAWLFLRKWPFLGQEVDATKM